MKTKTLPSIFCGLLFLAFLSSAFSYNSFSASSEMLETAKTNFNGTSNAYSFLVLFSAIILLYGYYAFFKKNEIGPLVFFAVLTALSQYCISLFNLFSSDYIDLSKWNIFMESLTIFVSPFSFWFVFSLISLTTCNRSKEEKYTPNDFYFWSTLFLLAVSLLFTTRKYSTLHYDFRFASLTDPIVNDFFANVFVVSLIILLFLFYKKRGLSIFAPIAVTLITLFNFLLLSMARFAYWEYSSFVGGFEYFESTAFNVLFGLLFAIFYAFFTFAYVKAVIYQKNNPRVKLSAVESIEEKVQQLSYIEQLLNDGILNYTEFKYLKQQTLNEKERYTPLTEDYLTQLDNLKNLLSKNILTEDEFIREKRKLLGLPVILVENDIPEVVPKKEKKPNPKFEAIKAWKNRNKKPITIIASIVLATIFIASIIIVPIIASQKKEEDYKNAFGCEITEEDFTYIYNDSDGLIVISTITPIYDFVNFSFTIKYNCSGTYLTMDYVIDEAKAGVPLRYSYSIALLEDKTGKEFTYAVIELKGGKKQNKYQSANENGN